MSAAARARRLDASDEIIVLERGEYVSFANCGLPYFVGGEITKESKLLVQTPESLAEALNLDVRVLHDVVGLDATAKTVTVTVGGETQTIAYDALVLSPGATAIRPPLPGLDSPRVQTLRTVGDAVAMREAVLDGANNAVVLGAGFIGIEAAEALAMRGIATTLVELAPHVLPPLETEMAYVASEELRRLGIDVREGVAASEVISGEASDTVVLADGTRLDADIIVLSVGVRPDTWAFEPAGGTCERGAICVYEHGRTNLPAVYAVGDAVMSVDAITGVRRPVALAGPANRAGRLVADAIFRPETARPMPAPIGTAVVRIGELTAAMTGANRASLDAAAIEYHTIHLHPNNHAGYFPGASTIDLLVHFRAGDGLSAEEQAVAGAEVNQQVDRRRTREVPGVIVRVQVKRVVLDPGRVERCPVHTGHRRGQLTDPHDSRTDRCRHRTRRLRPEDRVGDQASGAVRRSGEGHWPTDSGDGVNTHDRVAHRVHGGQVRTAVLVDADRATLARHTGGFEGLRVGTYAHGEHDDVSVEARAVGEDDGVGCLSGDHLGSCHTLADVDAEAPKLLGRHVGHLGLERRQDMRRELDEGRRDAPHCQRLGRLDPDEAGPEDDRVVGAVEHGFAHRDGIPNGTKGLHARRVKAGEGRPDGGRARREYERVVRDGPRLAAHVDGDGIRRRIEPDHVVEDPYVEVQRLGQRLGL